MKILRIILWGFGIGDIIVGFITATNAPSEFLNQGIGQILLGFVFCGAAIYCSTRIKAQAEEKEQYEKWKNH